MKMIRSSSMRFSTTCTLALVFVFLCAYTDSASAQNVQWRFGISARTQWGNVTLPPGDYTFSINAPGPFARVVLQRNKPGVPATIMIASISCDEIKVSAADSLVIVRHGEGTSVRELHLASIGLVFHFPAGTAETTSTAAAPRPVQIIAARGANK